MGAKATGCFLLALGFQEARGLGAPPVPARSGVCCARRLTSRGGQVVPLRLGALLEARTLRSGESHGASGAFEGARRSAAGERLVKAGKWDAERMPRARRVARASGAFVPFSC